jgi:CHAD domain-containing protein
MTDQVAPVSAAPASHTPAPDEDLRPPLDSEVEQAAPPSPSPDVRADDAWAEAGRKLFRFHLARALGRVPRVIAGDDPEDVHAMRVATRRMRATWRVFGDGFERDARRRYQGELRAIGSSLGAVRDMDVLIEILATYGEQRGARQRAGLTPLLAAWHAERLARHRELVAVLGSEQFSAFVEDYERFTDTPGLAAAAVPPHAPALVRNRMPSQVWDAYQAVWAFGDGVPMADLATLHELRIAAKWLRYTLEFIREPLDPEATALIRPVVGLQDDLGTQHDWHVAAERARAFADATHPTGGEAKAVARLIDALGAGVERRRIVLARSWQPLVATRYRRALGRAVARL